MKVTKRLRSTRTGPGEAYIDTAISGREIMIKEQAMTPKCDYCEEPHETKDCPYISTETPEVPADPNSPEDRLLRAIFGEEQVCG